MVDGPWKLSSYAASTGDATYVRNTRYSGPATGSLHALRVVSFTSDAAEFDSLLAAGGISYGYLPFNDAAQAGRVKSDGYTIQAWPTWGITYITPNFASPAAGPILKQLYVRQAMQQLINQAGYISSFLQGYGNPTYGPVPLVPSSQFVSRGRAAEPLPVQPGGRDGAAARARLEDRAQRRGRVQRPGTAANECGAGIPPGRR